MARQSLTRHYHRHRIAKYAVPSEYLQTLNLRPKLSEFLNPSFAIYLSRTHMFERIGFERPDITSIIYRYRMISISTCSRLNFGRYSLCHQRYIQEHPCSTKNRLKVYNIHLSILCLCSGSRRHEANTVASPS